MPKTTIDIGFGLIDVTAKADTTASCSDKQDFINPQDLSLEGVYPEAAATMETDYWRLDGSFNAFPDIPSNSSWGIWSKSMSDEKGMFLTPISLTLTFKNLHESKGLTFEFNPYGDNYASEMIITWYRDNSVLSTETFQPDKWRYTCLNKVVNYNKIMIQFLGTNRPFRYLKVQNILHGMNKYFSEGEIESASILEEVDLTSSELSINTLDFSIYSEDDDFNIFNPQGIYDLLQKKQQLSVEGDKDGEMMNLGYYYVKEWSSNDGLVDISAHDAIGVMDNTLFNGGMYKNVAAKTIINEIMVDAGFGYSISSSLVDIPVSGWISRCTHREALQQVAFAIGAYVDTSRGGMVKVCEQPPMNSYRYLGKDRKIVGTQVTLREYVSGVSLTEHTYSISTESKEVFKGDLGVGDHEIVFREPVANISVSGGTVLESSVNHCVVRVASAREVTVSGRIYIDSQRIVVAQVGDIEAGEKENIKEIKDATLISANNSKEAAQRLLDYYQKRIEQDLSFVIGSEMVGGSVDIEVDENVWRRSVIESMETDLAGGFITKAVVVGE